MTEDVRKALERFRAAKCGTDGRPLALSTSGSNHDSPADDWLTLAIAYDAERQADDDDPLTPAWVMSSLPAAPGWCTHRAGGDCFGSISWTGLPGCDFSMAVGSARYPWQTQTRGRFRALAKLLGVELKEPACATT